MKAAAIIVALCVGLAAAHTQEEIERKGIEVMSRRAPFSAHITHAPKKDTFHLGQ